VSNLLLNVCGIAPRDVQPTASTHLPVHLYISQTQHVKEVDVYNIVIATGRNEDLQAAHASQTIDI
jgi:hypothetical protein